MFAGLALAACAEPATRALTEPSDAHINGAQTRAVTGAIPPASNFVPRSDNQYFPLVPGTTFHYRSKTADGVEIEDFIVTSQTKVVAGVTTRVIEDIVRLDGVITEHTFDWLAQDTQSGDVWYFGEDSRQFDPVTGKPIGREGSWEAGRKGAEAGIIMEGNPKVGDTYNEEFAPGVAEDKARVQSLDAKANVPYENFRGCLKTENFTPLDPDVHEEKYYCPGVGLVLEVDGKDQNKLISITN
jgi:hypothetical protein